MPNEVVERWHHYGVEVSDRQENAQGCDANVQMLLGADCVNQFLRHKIERNGQVAWFSEFGWVLSGPQVTSQQPTESQGVTIQVSNIQTDIQVLWELDQPPTTTTTLPSFPLQKINDSYEVGLLWKTGETGGQ